MAEHLWTILCERHLVDPKTQQISLMNIAESLHIEGLSMQVEEAARQGKKGVLVNAAAEIVSWWHRSDPKEEEFHARIVIMTPAEQRLVEQPMDVRWGENRFTRIYINVNPVPVSTPGLYWFVVEQQKATKNKQPRWVVATRIPLYVAEETG